MFSRFTNLVSVVILSATSTIFATAAHGQFQPAGIPGTPRVITLPEAFERTFFDNDKDAFENRSIRRQFNTLFGPFPENEIVEDGENIHELYVDALEQQVNSDAILRTPDLPNPYNTSLLQLPGLVNINRPLLRGEYIYEQQPPRY